MKLLPPSPLPSGPSHRSPLPYSYASSSSSSSSIAGVGSGAHCPREPVPHRSSTRSAPSSSHAARLIQSDGGAAALFASSAPPLHAANAGLQGQHKRTNWRAQGQGKAQRRPSLPVDCTTYAFGAAVLTVNCSGSNGRTSLALRSQAQGVNAVAEAVGGVLQRAQSLLETRQLRGAAAQDDPLCQAGRERGAGGTARLRHGVVDTALPYPCRRASDVSRRGGHKERHARARSHQCRSGGTGSRPPRCARCSAAASAAQRPQPRPRPRPRLAPCLRPTSLGPVCVCVRGAGQDTRVPHDARGVCVWRPRTTT